LFMPNVKPTVNEQSLGVMRHWLQNRGFDKMWMDYFEAHNLTSVKSIALLVPEGPLGVKFRFMAPLIAEARSSCDLIELPWSILKQRYHTKTYTLRKHRCLIPSVIPQNWNILERPNPTFTSSCSESVFPDFSRRKTSFVENDSVLFPRTAASRVAAREMTRQRSCSAIIPPPPEILSPPNFAEHAILSPRAQGRQRGDSFSFDDDPRLRRNNPLGIVKMILKSGAHSGTVSPRCEPKDSVTDVIVPCPHSPPPSSKAFL